MQVSPSDEATGASSQQRVGIALSYAKRYALLAGLGLAPEDDLDGAVEEERKPAVEPPRRKSEATTKAAPPPPQVSPPAETEGLIWSGKILSVDEKTTKTKKRFWLVEGDPAPGYEAEGSATFSTFSESLMREAVKFIGTGDLVELAYTRKTAPGGIVYQNLDAIRPANSDLFE